LTKEVVNVCCPYFDVLKCAETVDHKHISCSIKGLIGNDETVFKCISRFNWQNCETFNKELDVKK